MRESTATGYDYVIVGGGAAGCVVAARLSEDPACRVLLLEAGGAARHPLIGIPGANVVTGTLAHLNWSDLSEPNPGLGGRQVYLGQGKVIGGGGSINGMMYLRGRPEDYDHWNTPGWEWEDVLPWFRAIETNERGASRDHGASGPMQIRRAGPTAPICDLFLQAAQGAGFALSDDLNLCHGEGFGYVDLNIAGGRRRGTAEAYLAPARRRANLTVLTGAQATGVQFQNGRACGVEYRRNGRAQTARAEVEVILALGAIGTPALLMHSGIGPAAALSALGVAVRHDSPEVGQNLQNHPVYRLMYTTHAPVTAYSSVRPLGAVRAGLEYLFRRKGILASGLFPVGGFLDGNAHDAARSVQVCMAPALVQRRKSATRASLPDRHGFTLLLNQGIPHSRGQVSLASLDPLARPRIYSGIFDDRRDLEVVVGAAARMRALVHDHLMPLVGGAEVQPVGPIRSHADLVADVVNTTASHYHYGGTCRMGGDAGAVLDAQLRVNGVRGLRVVDASAMPRMINANTHATTILIAECAAAFIRDPSGARLPKERV